jgi:hypothetical protein
MIETVLKYVCVFLYRNHQVHRDVLITLYIFAKEYGDQLEDTAEFLKPISISQGHVNVQNIVPKFTAPTGKGSLVHLV